MESGLLVRKIKIVTEVTGEVIAEILEERNPKTAEAVWKALPVESRANRWGEEVYFSTPISISEENAVEVVEMGDVAFWPPGKAICIFFGPTPASQGSEIRPASPVNVFAKIVGDPKIFSKIRDGDRIEVKK